MIYSLVNMPVLGFDLCRSDGGTTVADLLLAALQLDDDGVRRLAAAPREATGATPSAMTSVSAALRDLRAEQRDATTSAVASDDTVRRLERGMLGDFDTLVRFVRDDVLSWTWREVGSVRWQLPDAVAAVALLRAALADAYAKRTSTAAVTAVLTAAGPVGPTDLDLGPCAPAVRELLTGVAAMTPTQTAGLRAGVAGRGPRTRWAAAVHDASWAVYLTERLRPAAAAQLLAVRAFAQAGFTPRDGAYGVWNEISGAVQAAVVADLVPAETATLLGHTCAEVLGAA
jgi:hypothetical protein